MELTEEVPFSSETFICTQEFHLLHIDMDQKVYCSPAYSVHFVRLKEMQFFPASLLLVDSFQFAFRNL
jgi:hypothetical protein